MTNLDLRITHIDKIRLGTLANIQDRKMTDIVKEAIERIIQSETKKRGL